MGNRHERPKRLVQPQVSCRSTLRTAPWSCWFKSLSPNFRAQTDFQPVCVNFASFRMKVNADTMDGLSLQEVEEEIRKAESYLRSGVFQVRRSISGG